MLIFYTYTADKEAAEISKAQDAAVPFEMHSNEHFLTPKVGGTPYGCILLMQTEMK